MLVQIGNFPRRLPEAGLIDHYNSNPYQHMEECFDWADSQYNPGWNDEPVEFDSDGGKLFILW